MPPKKKQKVSVKKMRGGGEGDAITVKPKNPLVYTPPPPEVTAEFNSDILGVLNAVGLVTIPGTDIP